MNIVNATPHVIRHLHDDDTYTDYPYSGIVPRVDVTRRIIRERPRLVVSEYGDVIGLPEEVEGTLYIVSRVVANAAPFRNDLIVPCDFHRDRKDGKVDACRAFEVIFP